MIQILVYFVNGMGKSLDELKASNAWQKGKKCIGGDMLHELEIKQLLEAHKIIEKELFSDRGIGYQGKRQEALFTLTTLLIDKILETSKQEGYNA